VLEKRRRHRCGGDAILHRVVVISYRFSPSFSATGRFTTRGAARREWRKRKEKYSGDDHVVVTTRRRVAANCREFSAIRKRPDCRDYVITRAARRGAVELRA